MSVHHQATLHTSFFDLQTQFKNRNSIQIAEIVLDSITIIQSFEPEIDLVTYSGWLSVLLENTLASSSQLSKCMPVLSQYQYQFQHIHPENLRQDKLGIHSPLSHET